MNEPQKIAWHPYRPSAWLLVTGADAATFLQGQFSNDLRQTDTGGAVYGMWLNTKGKVIADSFIIKGRNAGEFLVGCYFCPADTVRRRLEEFIVADDVTIEDLTAGRAGVSLIGEGSGAWLQSIQRDGIIFRGRRTAGENWEWIVPISEAGRQAASLAGARELSAIEVERSRIAAGIPAVPRDIGPGELPNEGGLDADAISYDKGCYLGQEIMARLKTRGRLRRRLTAVRGAGPLPILPAPLWQAGRSVGELRTAAPSEIGDRFCGLALLSLEGVSRELPLSLSAADGPAVDIC